MKLPLPVPRLLPMTITAMAALLLVKSVALVRAAVPEAAAPAVTPARAETAPAPPPARPADAKAAPANGAAAAQPAAAASQAPPPPTPCEAPVSDSERALLLDLRGRRAELEGREAALAERAGVLAAAEQRLAARVDELGGLQRRLEALEQGRQQRDQANWRGLVRLYETMKPRDAAVIFNDLDLPVLLPVLDRMKESKAALVLAAMQPERARQVTAELAQLRTRANTPATPAPAPSEEKR